MLMLAFIAALLLAVIHLFAERIRFIDVIPRSRLLSASGGMSVAYVFVYLLPQLSIHQEAFQAAEPDRLLRQHVYVVALTGLATFYGMERYVRSRARSSPREFGSVHTRTFWIHIGSFALLNALVGYLLLHRSQQTPLNLILFTAAVGTNFLVNDYGLRQAHRGAYRDVGRWLLAAAVLLGWALGVAFSVHRQVLAVLFAFLSGGIVLNVLKEELPDERESRFSAFLIGAAAYSALLILV